MQVFKVSNGLQIEAVTEMEKPYLIIHDLLEEGGGDPLWVIIWPHEVKALIAALVEATVYLAGMQ